MKMILSFLVAAVLAVTAYSESIAQLSAQSKWLFNGTTYAKATTRTDTSATYSLRFYPYVELATYTSGADSGYMRIDVDLLIGGTWTENVVRDTVRFGDGLGDAGKTQGTTLRHPALTTNIFAAADGFRTRNTFVDPIPTADSVGPLKYYQRVDYRSH